MNKFLLFLAILGLSFGVSAVRADDDATAVSAAPETIVSEQIKIDPILKDSVVDVTVGPKEDPIAIEVIDTKEGKEDPIDETPIDIKPIDLNPGNGDLVVPGDKDGKGKGDPTPAPIPAPVSGGGSSSGGSSSSSAALTPLAVASTTETALSVDTTSETLASPVSAKPSYANGTLLRNGLDKKIYRVVKGNLQHVKTLKELRKYSGQRIINVDQIVIAAYLAS